MNKKLALFGIVVIFAILLLLNFSEKTQTITTPASESSNIVIALDNGNVDISDSTSDNVMNIIGNVKYRGKKPKVDGVLQISEEQSDISSVNLRMPSDSTVPSMTIAVGAGNTTLSLQKASVAKTALSIGAGNITITLPEDNPSQFEINLGAGNLQLFIPKNGKLDGIKVISVDSSFDLESMGFEKVKDGFQTKGFATAKVTSTIYLKGGAVELKVDSID